MLIDNNAFLELISEKSEDILILSKFINSKESNSVCLSRPLLGKFNREAKQLEEILDSYGAKNNRYWCAYRELIAAAKLFSNVCYILLHIYHSSSKYQLLPIEENFNEETYNSLDDISTAIYIIAGELLKLAKDYKIKIPYDNYNDAQLKEVLPKGSLVNDRKIRNVIHPGKTVVYLATTFLNLSEESNMLQMYGKVQRKDYNTCIPDPVNERRLRKLEHVFHNLQALYDTNILDSNIETVDNNLPLIRGHISIIFHILESAVELAHYYERHMLNHQKKEKRKKFKPPIDSDNLLDILMNYSIAFANAFLKAAQNLCRNMLKKYAELGEIEVPVPNYRGFHVRPSTLIAKIVIHYGSDVTMMLDNEKYNACVPLELFRANEKINAKKRQELAKQIANVPIVHKKINEENMKAAERVIFYSLMETHKLILYEQKISFDELDPHDGENLESFANRAIAHFLAVGKIDIETNLEVIFKGDKRVLADIKLLAENGYGEDDFGNNIVLPQELAYLRR